MSMKNSLLSFIIFLSLAACAPATTSTQQNSQQNTPTQATVESIEQGLADATALTGLWAGTYTCGQGVTGLSLKMTGDELGNVAAIFEFYADPLNASVPEGSYSMTGKYQDSDALVLIAGDWIVQPQDYGTINLDGVVNGESYAGVIPDFEGCSFFELEKVER